MIPPLRSGFLFLAVAVSAVAIPAFAQYEPYRLELEALVMPPDATPPMEDESLQIVLVADVDGDGRDDRIVTTSSSNRVLMYSQGAGGDWTAAPVAYALSGTILGLAAGDVNGDGRADVVASLLNGFDLLLSQADGVHTRHALMATERVATKMRPVLFDFDGDGALDLLIQDTGPFRPDGTVGAAITRVMRGDGQGGFIAKAEINTGDDVFHDVDVGDVTGDGIADLVTLEASAYSNGPIRIRAGNGGFGFAAPTALGAPFRNTIALGDFNGDGRLDIATNGYRDMLQTNRVAVFLHQPAGGLATEPVEQEGGLGPGIGVGTMRAIDLDDDGADDLVTTLDGHPHVLYHLQRGGVLSSPVAVLAAATVSQPNRHFEQSLAHGDFDGDRFPDLLVANDYNGFAVLSGLELHYSGTASPPGAPTVISAGLVQPGDNAARVRFAPAAADGGAPILQYRVLIDPPGPRDLGPTIPVSYPQPAEYEARVWYLDWLREYRFRVQARNEAGWGEPSAWSAPVRAHRIIPLRIVDTIATEGSGGVGGKMVFRIEVDFGAPPGGLTFDLQTRDYQAKAGEDYVARHVTGLHIPEGGTGFEFVVDLVGDDVRENSETFLLEATNIVGEYSGTAPGLGRIVNDDRDPDTAGLFLVEAVDGYEGDSGTTALRFAAELDAPLSHDVTFDLHTFAGADGGLDEAAPGVDFVVLSGEPHTIPAGQTRVEFDVGVIGDTTVESNEMFRVGLQSIVGAYEGIVSRSATIRNDDFTGLPALFLRDDRVVLTENQDAVVIDPLANDGFDASRLVGGLMAVPNSGSVLILSDFEGPGDDRMLYEPATDFAGRAAIRYALCDDVDRCPEASIEVVVRPIPEAALTLDVESNTGHLDVDVGRLRALPAASFETTPLVPGRTLDAALAVDPSPQSPWDGGVAGVGTRTDVGILPASASNLPWQVLADAAPMGAGDIDLYLGVDTDGDGLAEPGELRCTSAMAAAESCDFALDQAAGTETAYWAMLHNRSGGSTVARLRWAAVPLTAGDGTLVATAGGHLERGEPFVLRVGWNKPEMVAGDRYVGYLRVRGEPAAAGALVPVRIDHAEGWQPEALVLGNGIATSLRLPGLQAHRRMIVDVPEGASALAVQVRSGQPVDVYLIPAGEGSSPGIDAAPPTSAAAASGTQAGGNEDVLVGAPAPGRWYVHLANNGAETAQVVVTAAITATAPIVRPGSFFNPARGGHGLFVYPAGDQWAGLWYTYYQDRSPTWLYLQAAAPSIDGIWRAGLYRSAWNGTSNRLTKVGEATATPTGPDAFQFTYTLDGETGSEPMTSLGRGCPTIDGSPLDASSNWFDPLRAGTGYSVQLWPDYEMYIAFVYDAQGVPRFLTSENERFGGASAVLAFEQLEGFCPLCDRPQAPIRRDVGTLLRGFDAGTLTMGLDAFYTAGVPGWWTADDRAQPLGGPGTAQGCAP